MGVGVDNVDLQAAKSRGVVVTNTPGANSASVAELTVGLILTLARNLVPATIAAGQGGWPRMSGLTLEGKTVGLIGFGNIGKQVAKRLAGFGCSMIAYDVFPDDEFAAAHRVEMGPIDEVINQADFLSLHCTTVPETRGMVNAAFIEKMKPGCLSHQHCPGRAD